MLCHSLIAFCVVDSDVFLVRLIPLFFLAAVSGRRDVAYYGFGPFVTMALGVLIASVFVTGTIQWAADWLGDPREDIPTPSAVAEAVVALSESVEGVSPECAAAADVELCQEEVIRTAVDNYSITLDAATQPPIDIPTGFDMFSVAVLAVLLIVATYVVWLEVWLLRRKLVPVGACPPEKSHRAQILQAERRSKREVRRWRKSVAANTRTSPRNTRLHRAASWLLILLAIPAAVILSDYWWLGGGWVEAVTDWLEGPGSPALRISRWAIAAMVVAGGVYVQRSYRDPTRRRALGGVWDVATFWPRAYHPFAPPTYSARAVPELLARIKELLSDGERKLVLSAHSQGVPITMAVLAQLDHDELDRVAFLSYGSPTGSLYGHFFPAYYGPDCVKQIGSLLADADVGGGRTRWRNIWRITDWTGGYAFPPPRLSLDLRTVDCRRGIVYDEMISARPGAPVEERASMAEVAEMAGEVEMLWCDPHHDAEVVPGHPLPPSIGHHTYLSDPGYLDVCAELRALLCG